MRLRHYIYGVLLGFLSVFIMLLILASVVDYSDRIPVKNLIAGNQVSFARHLSGLDSSNINEIFPYNVVIDSININDIHVINSCLNELDSMFPWNKDVNPQKLSVALTQSLLNRDSLLYAEFNPDALLAIVQWAERFHFYADLDPGRSIFFNVVFDYWMNYVANKLSNYPKNNYSVKFGYRYRYLVSRCEEKGYSITIPISNIDKLVFHFSELRFPHIFNRFMGSPFWIKVLLGFLLLFTLFAYAILFLFFKRRL